MEKAYDLKALVSKLKDGGLDVAEDAAKVVAESVLAWVEESAKLSENKIDDFIAGLFPIAKPHILGAIDKIDQKVG